MGFSIGGLVSGALGSVANVLSTGTAGPLGTVAGAAIRGAIGPEPASRGGSLGPIAFSATPAMTGPTITGLGRIGLQIGAGGAVSAILARARQNTGRSVSSRTIRESVRVCGIATTANTFGLTESEVCQVAIRTGRRRARGISAADMRRTRSTIRKVTTIQRKLKALSTGRRTC